MQENNNDRRLQTPKLAIERIYCVDLGERHMKLVLHVDSTNGRTMQTALVDHPTNGNRTTQLC
jgi:hypothetical protein